MSMQPRSATIAAQQAPAVVEIETPRSLGGIIGMCGVVAMDTTSGRDLVLMRAQRCRRHGVDFVLVGWTVLDRPMEIADSTGRGYRAARVVGGS